MPAPGGAGPFGASNSRTTAPPMKPVPPAIRTVPRSVGKDRDTAGRSGDAALVEADRDLVGTELSGRFDGRGHQAGTVELDIVGERRVAGEREAAWPLEGG